ncbi:MAG: RNase P subunit p30 family protein [Haloplanus sp.]
MYEAVHAHPDGESTAARFARDAARMGFEGVVVRARGADPDYEALAAAPVDVVDAVEVVASGPEQASGTVGSVRPDHTLVCLRGGTDALNRFAVEHERVDVLTRPMAGGGGFNHVLARSAADNGVRVEFDFGPVLRSTGGPRVKALGRLRTLRELVAHYDAPYVVSANPTSHLHLRGPRELVAVGEEAGFAAEWVRAGLREWGVVAERNRERQSESFIGPGVERGRYEKDP